MNVAIIGIQQMEGYKETVGLMAVLSSSSVTQDIRFLVQVPGLVGQMDNGLEVNHFVSVSFVLMA